jgi:hypothetical protein
MTKRRRGLIPMTPQDTAAALAIGLTETDLRVYNDLFLTMKAMPATRQFGLIVRALYRRGIRRAPLGGATPAPPRPRRPVSRGDGEAGYRHGARHSRRRPDPAAEVTYLDAIRDLPTMKTSR